MSLTWDGNYNSPHGRRENPEETPRPTPQRDADEAYDRWMDDLLTDSESPRREGR